jgi:hypothetical protein
MEFNHQFADQGDELKIELHAFFPRRVMNNQWAADRHPLPTTFCPNPWPSLLTSLLPTIAKPDTIRPQSAAPGADRDSRLCAASLRIIPVKVIRKFIDKSLNNGR